MTRRTAALRWVPWLILGVFGALVALVGALALRGTMVDDTLSVLIFAASFALVGALIAARRPGNSIGWLCLVLGVAGGSIVAARAYATHGLLVDPGSLPSAHLAAWWSGWAGTLLFGTLTMLLPLHFPTGRPPSPRWRPVVWLALASMALGILAAAFSPGPLAGAPEFLNPLGVEILGDVMAPLEPVAPVISLIAILLSAASLVARYRHARGTERQQLKWFFYAFLLSIAILNIGTIGGALLVGGDPNSARDAPLYVLWWSVVWPATITMIPIAIGIAVLRYRLYDIDLIINRTLVYGALTAILAAAYVGAIAVLQVVLQPFTQGSQLAVAASTLAVAALFQPLRARIQRVVDRRFYRSRYDAERTVDRFAGRLRDELDLAALSAELIGVVGETVRPARAGLWLRSRS
jgi:hypothetical protein